MAACAISPAIPIHSTALPFPVLSPQPWPDGSWVWTMSDRRTHWRSVRAAALTPGIVRKGKLSAAKSIANALIAQSGVQGALLAEKGVTGPLEILDSKDAGLQGFLDGFGPDRVVVGAAASPARHPRRTHQVLSLHRDRPDRSAGGTRAAPAAERPHRRDRAHRGLHGGPAVRARPAGRHRPTLSEIARSGRSQLHLPAGGGADRRRADDRQFENERWNDPALRS